MERPINEKRVVLAGGSGFLGKLLAKELLARNYEVVVLTRSPRERSDGVREAEWSGTHIGEWIKCLDGVDAVVNLAGRNINCRHTPKNILEITESRVNSVRAVASALGHIAHPPRVWARRRKDSRPSPFCAFCASFGYDAAQAMSKCGK